MTNRLAKFIILFGCFGVSLFSGIFLFFTSAQAAVVINEVMYDPDGDDNNAEWVELYNNGESEVDLASYFLEWGGTGFNAKLKLSGTIEAKKYFLIGGSLIKDLWSVEPDLILDDLVMQNGGSESDGVRLFDGVSYYDTLLYDIPNSNNLRGDDANIGLELCFDVTGGHSLSRKITGVDNNLASDWEDLSAPTPHNSSYEESNSGNENNTSTISNIIINELLPNPVGVDDNEWIELKNLGTTTIDLVNWKISDLANTSYIIENTDFATTTILGNGFFILLKNITGISLNNTGGETLRLFDEQNNLVCEISYTESAEEEIVWARDENGIWHWSITQTQNSENIITEIQKETSGGGGSGASYIKTYAQRFKINEIMANPVGSDFGSLNLAKPFDQKKVLNKEINFEDLGEWIEIKSMEGEMFSLVDWKIKNETGEYVIKENDFSWPYLEAGQYYLLPKFITNLNLKNTGGEEVQLIDPTGKIVDSIKYSKTVLGGEAYMLSSDGQYYWTKTPTPLAQNLYTRNNLAPSAYFEVSGEINKNQEILLDASESTDPEGEDLIYEWHFNYPVSILNLATTTFATTSALINVKLDKLPLKIGLKVIDSENLFDEKTETIKPEVAVKYWWEESAGETTKATTTTLKKTTTKVLGASLLKTNLESIKELADGTNVEVEGIVSVLPGVLGVNIFYVAGSGLQIYSSKKDWPDLQIGERIKIIGELSTAYGERRLKIKDKNSLQKVADGEAPAPYEMEIEELNNETSFWTGSLIKIVGEITDIKKDYFWLDDGSGEIKVTIKTGTQINLADLNLTIGSQAEVIGIFSPTESGLRLLPRSVEDILITKALGAQAEKKSFNYNSLLKYFLVGALAIIIILGIMVYRLKKKV